MSSFNRNVTTTTFGRQLSLKITTQSAIINQSRFDSAKAPTPEPRKKSTIIKDCSKDQGDIAHESGELHPAKLVTISYQDHEPSNPEISKRTSFETSKKRSMDNKLSTSPSSSVKNDDYSIFEEEEDVVGDDDDDDDDDDDEELVSEYYDDDQDYDKSGHNDELVDLSRQSMVPLHELIAYYQYIQQGDNPVNKEPVSRQSSCASKQTVQTKHSQSDETTDESRFILAKANIETEQNDLKSSISEPEVTKIQISVPKVQVEKYDSVDSNSDGLQKVIDDNQEDDIKESEQSNTNIPVTMAPLKDKRRVRANVVLELINSERDFVKHLRDVVEGYLYPARRHPEIFTGQRINAIFSNIEQLYEFQRKFLRSLELCIDWDDLADSEVGNCFLEYENGFSVYHFYCNNHPNATSELQDLYTKPRFVKFFEACRLLQNMIDISLDGFLLTPIQKICKYPLQLNELLKNTDDDHRDYHPVTNALESMRNCANLANERKRRIEALADVLSFQEKVENWFGPKLSETSSILIHSGEVSKMNTHTWSQGVQLYLFDKLLLYCKKDLLKRNCLILKGRIRLHLETEISEADEYKSKKSFKIFCEDQQKWFVFTTRSEREKDEWMRAFERERNLVESDETDGFSITDRELGIARRTLQNRKHSRSARYRNKRPDTAIVDQLDIDDANTIMNRTLSLPSCIHPSHVMNFVEDSRVISHKKNASPNQSNLSNRSPVDSNQHLPEQENQQHQPPQPFVGSWFKKMGSKKLAKSQVYTVNGSGSSSAKHDTVSPSSIIADASAMRYDQLEKKHRDHMVSEVQARLFRLNNDLPPTSFASQGSITSTKRQTSFIGSTQSHSLSPSLSTHRNDHSASRGLAVSPRNASQVESFNSRTSYRDSIASMQQNPNCPKPSSFETTVMLSSGRIVTVREDAV